MENTQYRKKVVLGTDHCFNLKGKRHTETERNQKKLLSNEIFIKRQQKMESMTQQRNIFTVTLRGLPHYGGILKLVLPWVP